MAWDFAVTAGMREDRMVGQGAGVANVFGEYENFKKEHQNTER